MGIFIGKFEFDGPFHDVNELLDQEGLYAVLHCDGDDYELIHVSHADNVRERIEQVPAPNSPKGKVLLAAYYTPSCGNRQRTTMVEDIQKEFAD